MTNNLMNEILEQQSARERLYQQARINKENLTLAEQHRIVTELNAINAAKIRVADALILALLIAGCILMFFN